MQKIAVIFYIITILSACKNSKQSIGEQSVVSNTIVEVFQNHKMEGAMVIFDDQENLFYSNDFEYAKEGTLPASTFKIANTLIGLELGFLDADTTIFRWDGEPRFLKSWEADLSLKQAFKASCVPCYQELARNVGADWMNQGLEILGYPGMIVDSTNIDQFWLQGNSKINLFEQIDFIRRIYTDSLEVAPLNSRIIKDIMLTDSTESYTLSGKTGWVVTGDNNIGWYVGRFVSNRKTYYFATRIEPTAKVDIAQFPALRKKITMDVFSKMNILKK